MTVNAACDCSAWCGSCVRWSKYSTPRLTARWLLFLRVCAMFEGLTEFCFVFRFGFRASLLNFTPRIERLHFCYYCADVWRVFAHYCSECSRARPSTGRSGQVRSSTACVCRSFHDAWPISCSRWTEAVWLRPVARCALVRNSLQTNCLQCVMTRYHTLDIMLEIGARK